MSLKLRINSSWLGLVPPLKQEEGQQSTVSYQPSAQSVVGKREGGRVLVDTRSNGETCWCGHALFAADSMPPHDLQQAGVIGQAEPLCGLRDAPIVALQRRHDDTALGLGPERVEARRAGACTCPPRPARPARPPDPRPHVAHARTARARPECESLG